jgi:hypothetical protein
MFCFELFALLAERITAIHHNEFREGMMKRWSSTLVIGCLLLLAISSQAAAEEMPPKLTDEQKKLLDELLKDTVVDPKGCQRASIKTTVRSVWASSAEARIEGWLKEDPATKSKTFLCNDGSTLPITPESDLQTHDFVVWSKQRYAPRPKTDENNRGDVFARMHQRGLGVEDDSDLAIAAWLYRLGEEQLAAQAYQAATKDRDERSPPPRESLRSSYAWSLFAKLVHAYMVRADEEALTAGEILLVRFPEQVKSDKDEKRRSDYDKAPAIVADLKRRKDKKVSGKAPPTELPAEAANWSKVQQAAFWIEQLDEVDARQWGQPGGISFHEDLRILALIKLGDAAVPQLIDVIEKDKRLTRSVHFWRDFAPNRTVIAVPEVALTAVMSILRVRAFDPASTGDNFTSRGEDHAQDTAARLRKYWDTYGKLPFDERMMKVLTDPQASAEAKCEAASNLATLNDTDFHSTTVFSSRSQRDSDKPNPALTKFKNSSVAEAILVLLKSELKSFEEKKAADEQERRSLSYDREKIQRRCLSALVELGDNAAAPEIAKLARVATDFEDRQLRALAAHALKDSAPARELIRDFQEQKLELFKVANKPDTDERDSSHESQLMKVISFMIDTKLPEADLALQKLADPQYKFAEFVQKKVLSSRTAWHDDGPWLKHPFCLKILRRMLEDTTLTDSKYEINDNRLSEKSSSGSSNGPIPEFLQDPEKRIDATNARVCDEAAEKLAGLLCYAPRFHPLLKDADVRLAGLKREYDRFNGNFRQVTNFERHLMKLDVWSLSYIPNIKLTQPATAADVATGKAIFQQQGRGQSAKLELPAAAKLVKEVDNNDAPYFLILQAELDETGNTVLGVLSATECQRRPASDFGSIQSVADLLKEAQEKQNEEK